MKLINKAIRKLSRFDIIIIVILAIFAVFFFIFFYRQPEYVDIRVKVTDKDVLYAWSSPAKWYANRFQIGDTELDTLGRKLTEIKSIESLSVSPDRTALYLDLTVRALFDRRTKLYYVKGKKLIFGSPIQFDLSHVTFFGIVTEFPGSDKQNQIKIGTATISARARHIEPTVAESIKKGDKIFNSKGIQLAEILKITILPAETVTQNVYGDLFVKNNPLYKDLVITVSVRTKTVDEEPFIFDNEPLRIAEILPLNFSNVSIWPFITDYQISY